MAIIEGKCPECGATLKINDKARGELVCPFCGSNYSVEMAVHLAGNENKTVDDLFADKVIAAKNRYVEFEVCLMNDCVMSGRYGMVFHDKVELYVNDSLAAVLEKRKIMKIDLDTTIQNKIAIRIIDSQGGTIRFTPLVIEKNETSKKIEVDRVGLDSVGYYLTDDYDFETFEATDEKVQKLQKLKIKRGKRFVWIAIAVGVIVVATVAALGYLAFQNVFGK